MRARFAALIFATSAVGHSAPAQATTITAPSHDYLLELRQGWEAGSVLGSLPRRAMAAGGIELRVWGGYGLVRQSVVRMIIRRDDSKRNWIMGRRVPSRHAKPFSVAAMRRNHKPRDQTFEEPSKTRA